MAVNLSILFSLRHYLSKIDNYYHGGCSFNPLFIETMAYLEVMIWRMHILSILFSLRLIGRGSRVVINEATFNPLFIETEIGCDAKICRRVQLSILFSLRLNTADNAVEDFVYSFQSSFH